MYKGIIFKVLLVGFITLTLLVMPRGGVYAAEAKWPEIFSLGTGNTGSSYHALGLAWAAVLSKTLGQRFSSEATGGSSANIAMLMQGKLQFGQANTEDNFFGSRGIDLYKDRGKADIRLMMVGYDVTWGNFARTAAGIKDYPDLKGKICYFDLPPAPIFLRSSVAYLEAYGLTEKDVSVRKFTTWTAKKDAFAEGKADAGAGPTTMGDLPHPSINEIFQLTDMILMNPSDKAMDAISKKYPFYGKGIVKAGTYKGQNYNANSISVPITWIVRTDAPEEWVYKSTKATFENLDQLIAANAGFKSFDLKGAIRSFVIPYHPGAIKYYKEAKIWDAAMDERQKKALQDLKN